MVLQDVVRNKGEERIFVRRRNSNKKGFFRKLLNLLPREVERVIEYGWHVEVFVKGSKIPYDASDLVLVAPRNPKSDLGRLAQTYAG